MLFDVIFQAAKKVLYVNWRNMSNLNIVYFQHYIFKHCIYNLIMVCRRFISISKVKNSTSENETVYQQWVKNLPSMERNSNLPRYLFILILRVRNWGRQPACQWDSLVLIVALSTFHFRVDKIATGSDYVAFNQQIGIPSAEIRYIESKVS